MSRPPIPYDNKRGYDDFIRRCYDTDPATGKPVGKTGNTKVGHQLDGTNNLHETALRLIDGESILQENLQVMMDPSSKKKHKKVAASNSKKLGPLVTGCAANIVSPIAGTKDAHQRLERMEEGEDSQSQSKGDKRLSKIESFVENEGLSNNESKPKPNKVTPPRKPHSIHARRERSYHP